MTLRLKLPPLPRLSWPAVTRDARDLAVQAVGLLSALVGVSAWSWPSACVLGGLVVIAAVERQPPTGGAA